MISWQCTLNTNQYLIPIEPIEAITGVKEETAEACVGFVTGVGLIGRCSPIWVNVGVGVEWQR
jgi:hypothetical protein